MERVKGIEPSSKAWEAAVLPLNYTRHPERILSSITGRRSTFLATTPRTSLSKTMEVTHWHPAESCTTANWSCQGYL